MTWLKNGSPVGVEWARVSVSPSGALELDPLRAHDAGHYACRVALLSHPHVHRYTHTYISQTPPHTHTSVHNILINHVSMSLFKC